MEKVVTPKLETLLSLNLATQPGVTHYLDTAEALQKTERTLIYDTEALK